MSAGSRPRPMKYNPAFLGDDTLIDGFSARVAELAAITEIVRENTGESNQHMLVVAPRGFGKTTLALRVAAEIRRDPELGRQWYPLVFSEESYEVESAAAFWLEALFHLHRQTGQERWRATYERLRGERNAERLHALVLAELHSFLAERHRQAPEGPPPRFLIIAENLQQIIQEQFSTAEAWSLRHTLQTDPSIMLLATAVTRFAAIDEPEAALYSFFRVVTLEPLDAAACGDLFQRITGQVLLPLQGRALQILTGGNPRLVTIFSSLARTGAVSDLADELTHLLDEHTEFFRSNIESLPPLERRVFTALAEIWRPAIAQELADFTRLDVSKVSAVLSRLEARGAVSASVKNPRRKRYQLAERLYNIFYLMRRHGVQSERVRYLVDFIVAYYYDAEALLAQTLRMISDAEHARPDQRKLLLYVVRNLIDRFDASNKQEFLLKAPSEQLAALSGVGPGERTLMDERAVAERDHEEFIGAALEWMGTHPFLAGLVRILVELDPTWKDLGVQLDATWSKRFSERVQRLIVLCNDVPQSIARRVSRLSREVARRPETPLLDVLLAMAVAFALDDERTFEHLAESVRKRPAGRPWHKVLRTYLSHAVGRGSGGKGLVRRLDAILAEEEDDLWAPLLAAVLLDIDGPSGAADSCYRRSHVVKVLPAICEIAADTFEELQEYEHDILFTPKYIAFAPLLDWPGWYEALCGAARFLFRRIRDFDGVLAICVQCDRVRPANVARVQPALLRGLVLLSRSSTQLQGLQQLRQAVAATPNSASEAFEVACVELFPLSRYAPAKTALQWSWREYVVENADELANSPRPVAIRAWLEECGELLPGHSLRTMINRLSRTSAADALVPLRRILDAEHPTLQHDALLGSLMSAVVWGQAGTARDLLRASRSSESTEVFQTALALLIEEDVQVPREVFEVAIDLRDLFRFYTEIYVELGLSDPGRPVTAQAQSTTGTPDMS